MGNIFDNVQQVCADVCVDVGGGGEGVISDNVQQVCVDVCVWWGGGRVISLTMCSKCLQGVRELRQL